MSFTERMGLTPARSLTQTTDLDADTRTELWNIIFLTRNITREKDLNHDVDESITSALWAWYLKKPRDEQPYANTVWSQIKRTIINEPWFNALECVEECGRYLHRFSNQYTSSIPNLFDNILNTTLEQYLVGYRWIDRKLVPIDDNASSVAVAEAVEATASFIGARHHLSRATDLLSDRSNPDYPNSIKESISAVESIVASVTGEGTLGAGLKKLKTVGIPLHPALESAWSKMYGWTSDAEGIRHAAVSEADADQSLAKYMLVACSAFVSYVIEAGRKSALI